MTGLNKMEIVNHLIEQESCTLTHARDLINGCKHPYQGSGATLATAQVNYQNVVFMTTMALSSLVDTFVSASYLFGNRHNANWEGYTHKQRMRVGKVALAFISGTGLDLMIEYYKLDYDADEIREKFYGIFRVSA